MYGSLNAVWDIIGFYKKYKLQEKWHSLLNSIISSNYGCSKLDFVKTNP